MHYRRLGRSGLKVSEISLGAWITFGAQVGQETTSSLVHAAYEAGENFFDNADVYANGQAEIELGKAIQDLEGSFSFIGPSLQNYLDAGRILRKMSESSEIKIIGAFYDLENGEVTFME